MQLDGDLASIGEQAASKWSSAFDCVASELEVEATGVQLELQEDGSGELPEQELDPAGVVAAIAANPGAPPPSVI